MRSLGGIQRAMAKKVKASTIEEMLEILAVRRFYISSLYQMNRDHWMCSIRPAGKVSTGNGQGETALMAIKIAYSRASKDDSWDYARKERKPSRVVLGDDKPKQKLKRKRL